MPNNITSERMRIGIDQVELARMLGVSASTVSRWERNVLKPYGSDLVAMHEVFGCSTDYLLGISDERNHFRAG